MKTTQIRFYITEKDLETGEETKLLDVKDYGYDDQDIDRIFLSVLEWIKEIRAKEYSESIVVSAVLPEERKDTMPEDEN